MSDSIVITHSDRYVLVTVPATMNQKAAKMLTDQMSHLSKEGHVIVNLSQMQTFSSSFTGALVRIHTSTKTAGYNLVIYGCSAHYQSAINTMNLHRCLTIVATLKQAEAELSN